MRALVVGGTGPTGPFLVQGLLQRGYQVTILHRGTHEVPEIPPEVEHIHTDPHFRDSLDQALAGRAFDLAIATYGRLRLVAATASVARVIGSQRRTPEVSIETRTGPTAKRRSSPCPGCGRLRVRRSSSGAPSFAGARSSAVRRDSADANKSWVDAVVRRLAARCARRGFSLCRVAITLDCARAGVEG